MHSIQWPVFAHPVAPHDWVFLVCCLFGCKQQPFCLPLRVVSAVLPVDVAGIRIALRCACWHSSRAARALLAFEVQRPPAAGIRPPAGGIRIALCCSAWHSNYCAVPLLAFALRCPSAAGIRAVLRARCWHSACTARPRLAFEQRCAFAAACGIGPAPRVCCWHSRCAARSMLAFDPRRPPAAGIRAGLHAGGWHWPCRAQRALALRLQCDIMLMSASLACASGWQPNVHLLVLHAASLALTRHLVHRLSWRLQLSLACQRPQASANSIP
jgi:hypothetical protein